jgi:hypothetical protein
MVDNIWYVLREGSVLYHPDPRKPGVFEEPAEELPAAIVNIGKAKEYQVVDHFYALELRYSPIPTRDVRRLIKIARVNSMIDNSSLS